MLNTSHLDRDLLVFTRLSSVRLDSEEAALAHCDKIASDIDLHCAAFYQQVAGYSGVPSFEEIGASTLRIGRDAPTPDDILEEGVQVDSLKKLDATFSSLYDIQRRIDALENISHQITHGLGGNKSIEQKVAEVRKDAHAKIDAALKYLNKQANDRVPKRFKELRDGVLEKFIASGHWKFASIDQPHVLLTAHYDKNERLHFVFSSYHHMIGVEDDSGMVLPHYYIAFTCIVGPDKKLTYHVNTLHKFRVPGTFRIGSKFVDVASGVSELDSALSVDHLSSLSEVKKAPISTEDVNTAFKRSSLSGLVASVSAPDDRTLQIRFTKLVTESNLNKVVESVIQSVTPALRSVSKAQLKYQKMKMASGYAVNLSFANVGAGKASFTEDQISILRNHLGMDEDQVALLKRVIHKGH